MRDVDVVLVLATTSAHLFSTTENSTRCPAPARMELGILGAATYSAIVLPRAPHMPPAVAPTLRPFLYRGMVMIEVSEDLAIHVHHWIIYGAILCLRVHPVVSGFCLAMCLQGFLYSDRFELFVPSPYR